MSADLWRSEVVTYGFMLLNVLAVALGLVWAWRRGLLSDPEDTMRTALGFPPEATASKESGDVR